jgi:HEAT repeat protein
MAGNGRVPAGAPAAFLAALAGGSSVAEAAKLAGKSERQAYRYLADPAVKASVQRLRADMTGQALGVLVKEMAESVRELVKLRSDPNPQIRIQAARSLLTIGLDFRAALDVEARLSAVEAKLNGSGPDPQE